MIRYRLHPNYKYQLVNASSVQCGVRPLEGIGLPYVRLEKSGVLTALPGYAWDGPSGIAIDTRNFLRPSLFHDCLYQLMRGELLGLSQRIYADDMLKRLCLDDGMSMLRAWYVYKSVRMFGEKFAKPQADNPFAEILAAP